MKESWEGNPGLGQEGGKSLDAPISPSFGV